MQASQKLHRPVDWINNLRKESVLQFLPKKRKTKENKSLPNPQTKPGEDQKYAVHSCRDVAGAGQGAWLVHVRREPGRASSGKTPAHSFKARLSPRDPALASR